MVLNKKQNSAQKNTLLYDIENDRTGGMIALSGFSYQLLFSCFIVLEFLDNKGKYVKFEGIEDVDLYKSMVFNDDAIYHIQLKYSEDKKDASFFDSILKNFLEVYLTDKKNKNRFFKLVYDASIAKGNLSKLINNKLDKSSKSYWNKKINKIREDYPHWNWVDFNFSDFYNQLRFQNFPRDSIINKIKQLIINRFSIDTGNENLFVNSLFYHIFHRAQNREEITYKELLSIIQDIKDDISKGYKNPSYKWIDKINFKLLEKEKYSEEYFEGKKATPADIVNNLPVRREKLEETIINSIKNNQITVIKSSSGQGKTTLAWQVAYNLQSEYSIYKLNWCKETKEINNIVDYFNSRLKIGEKLLIILDNLNVDLKEWNSLSQKLADKLVINYSILVTTREDDWYSFAGDQSNLKSLNIIDLFIDENEAEKIYFNLKDRNRIHENIKNWQSSWEKVKDKKLLIEYIYLLTHGEMIEERISYQLKKITQENNSDVKLEVLRQITLADTMGIKLHINNMIEQFNQLEIRCDLNSIIKSVENEYLVKINQEGKYVEGLHTVRSQHIVDILHDYYPISKTFKKLIIIVEELYIGKLYKHIPLYIDAAKDEFYEELANISINKSYNFMMESIKGIFSGSILKYYKSNHKIFDDADKHGGLFLFLNEINPWNNKKYGAEVKSLESISEIMPDNENIKYLLNLSYSIEKFKLKESDFYIYTYYLYSKLKNQPLKRNISNYSFLANWLFRVNEKFDIVTNLNFNKIWEDRDKWKYEELGQLMYIFHSLSEEVFLDFINKNKEEIFRYLRIKTNSLEIYDDDDGIHIKYILLPQDIQKANKESVERINTVCKFLPIYNIYYTDAISPKVDLVDNFINYRDAHKEMPKRNVIMSFNTDLNELWHKSILMHYEFVSVYDWQKYWVDLREKVVDYLKLNIKVLEKILKHQNLAQSIINSLEEIRVYILNSLIREKPFPFEERPFEEKSIVNDYTNMKKGYFTDIRNYLNNFINIIQKNSKNNLCKVALVNLKDSRINLKNMQEKFNKVCSYTEAYFNITSLEEKEILWLDRLIILTEYYLNNNPKKGEFSRHSVKVWKKEERQKKIKSINNKITKIEEQSNFKFLKLNKVLIEDKLITVPLGVFNSDLTDEDEAIELLIELIPFIDIEIDYIILFNVNEKLQALPSGVRVSNLLLKELKSSMETGKELTLDNMTTPKPCEITKKQVSCFRESIELLKIQRRDFEDIDILLFLLWEYSQYQIKLETTKNEEKEYYIDKLNKKASAIEENFNSIKDNIPPGFEEEIINLKNEIINKGNVISDTEVNNLLNEILMHINNNFSNEFKI